MDATKKTPNVSDSSAITAYSRAIAELRSGRAILLKSKLGTLMFRAAEFGTANHSPIIAAIGLDHSLLGQTTPAEADNITQQLALKLLKNAGLLPAFIIAQADEHTLSFHTEHLETALQHGHHHVQLTAQANLPTHFAEQTNIFTFRSQLTGQEHVALVVGDPASQAAPLVRVHSSCLTGDLFASLRCDCGDQLAVALAQIAENGHGVLCYLQQEGRGIGITNKIRAYKLQQEGQDTLDANLSLGFAADERDFGLAASMLKALKLSTITLLSNNPDKVAQLEKNDIKVAKRTSLKTQNSAFNTDYLATKATRFGHRFI